MKSTASSSQLQSQENRDLAPDQGRRAPSDSEIRVKEPATLNGNDLLNELQICAPDDIDPSKPGWKIVLYPDISKISGHNGSTSPDASSVSSPGNRLFGKPEDRYALRRLWDIAKCDWDRNRHALIVTHKVDSELSKFTEEHLNIMRKCICLAQAPLEARRQINEMTDPKDITTTIRGFLHEATDFTAQSDEDDFDESSASNGPTLFFVPKELPRAKKDYIDIIQRKFKVITLLLPAEDEDLLTLCRILKTLAYEEKLFFDDRKIVTNQAGHKFVAISLQINPQETDKRLAESAVKQLMSFPYILFR